VNVDEFTSADHSLIPT